MRRTPLMPMLVLSLLPMTLMGSCSTLEEQTRATPGPSYPMTMPMGEVHDIQVFRDVGTMRFTNTTPNQFGESRIWINQRFSRLFEGVAPGETVELPLIEFVDEYGDTFRAGGFFANRSPEPLVLVQIESGEGESAVLDGFLVVENRYE